MRLVWPVPYYWDGRAPRVSSGFRTSSRPTHDGVDIMYERRSYDRGRLHHELSPNYYMPEGVAALAMAPGTVKVSRYVTKGGYVVIDHGGGLESHSMHMRDLAVRPGQRVGGGQRIGTISHAPSGYTLNHLHFQVKKDGRWVDPERILAGAAVALPPLPWWAWAGLGAGALWAFSEWSRRPPPGRLREPQGTR